MAIISTINRLTLTLFLEQLCFSIVMVVFLSHVTTLGGTQLFMGTIDSISSLIGLIWSPIIGSLGDTYGRKYILIKVLLMSAACNSLLVISNSLVVIFISRILVAFARPITLLTPAASEVLSKEEQSSYFNRLPAVIAISMITGSLISGFLSESAGPHFCYFLMVIINLINYGNVNQLPEVKKKEEKTQQESLPLPQLVQKEVGNVLKKLTNVKWKEYSDIFSTKLIFDISHGFFFRCFSAAFLEFGIKGRALGYVITFMSSCTIVSNIVLMKLKKKFYADDTLGKNRLFHASVLLFLTAFIMTFSNSFSIFATALLPMSVGSTLADSTFTEALMARTSDEDKGGISGAFESITSFTGLFMPITVGIMNDMFGIKFTLKMAVLTTITGITLTYRNK